VQSDREWRVKKSCLKEMDTHEFTAMGFTDRLLALKTVLA